MGFGAWVFGFGATGAVRADGSACGCGCLGGCASGGLVAARGAPGFGGAGMGGMAAPEP